MLIIIVIFNRIEEQRLIIRENMIKGRSREKNIYLARLKSLILSLLEDEPVKIIVFGSRARKDSHRSSDVDIGLIPHGKLSIGKITELKEKIEDLNIPYKVEIVDFSQVSESFRKEAFKEVVVWKD